MANKFIEIKTNLDKEIYNFSNLKKHIRLNAEESLDISLDRAVTELKDIARNILQDKIRIQPEKAKENSATPEIGIPKAKNDLIKYIFGQDIVNSDYLRRNSSPATKDDNSNVFVVKNKRIKIWQSLTQSSVYAEEERRIKDRLINGIILDNNGRVYKLSPNDIKGIKLECSRTEGETLNSTKKFDAYKNSNKISRNKYDSPFQRVAVWTMRQEDVDFAMKHAISIDDIIDSILNNDYESAFKILNTNNFSNKFDKELEKIKNLKLDKNLTPDIAALNDIIKLINNLKIEKKIQDNITKYTLFSTYGDEAEKNEKFFEEFNKQLFLWKVGNEEYWIKAILDGIIIALKNFEGTAKIIVK
jgi:hypothetical protein